MFRSFNDIKNFSLAARDGEIGKVKELYFDDQTWTVRYVVVDTGGWLTGRKVLIGPQALGLIDESSKLIAVHLTKKQVEDSPPITAEEPVSRQHEEELHRYYGYRGYWIPPAGIAWGGASPVAVPAPPETQRAPKESRGDPHLRRSGEVGSYSIHATDGNIGSVDDFIVDDGDWGIRYLVISRGWWPEKKVAISPLWVEQVSWETSEVHVPFTRETIKQAPEWDETGAMTRDYEIKLNDYYGRMSAAQKAQAMM